MKTSEIGYRSYGLELTGPRVPRSTIAVLDYYPRSQRLILSDLMMPRDEESDLDQALVDFFQDQPKLSKSLLVTNAPLSFPPLLSKKMGASHDTIRQEIEWMEHLWKQLKPQPRKFLDYVHRPVEIYLRHQCSERFAFADAIGSNQILLAARMLKLRENIKAKFHESAPRASFHRIAKSLKARSFILKGYSSLSDGLEARRDFMNLLQKKMPELFIFDESLEMLVLHIQAFHAFILALTGHLKNREYCERPPHNFPKKSNWLLLPKQVIDWERVI